jgi:hypothetical protein
MRLRWNTTLGLVVIVAGSAVLSAVVAAVYAAFAGGRDNRLLGPGLVLASVVALAGLRFSSELVRLRASGEHLSPWRRLLLLLASLVFALFTIGISGLAFLMAFGMLMGIEWNLPYPSFKPLASLHMLIGGVVAATLAGVGVGSLVRRAFGPDVPQRRRLVRLLAPLAIVALLVLGETTRQRVVYRLAQVAKHDEWARYNVPRRTAAIVPGSFVGWELAQHHAQMRQKWFDAASRPWLEVEPDPPELNASSR